MYKKYKVRCAKFAAGVT